MSIYGIPDIPDIEPKTKPYLWDQAEGIAFCSKLEKHLDPEFHVAMGGSVLYRGHSYKDLDVIIYRHAGERWSKESKEEIHGDLERFGMQYNEAWQPTASRIESNRVEVWLTADGKRVDFFFLEPQHE